MSEKRDHVVKHAAEVPVELHDALDGLEQDIAALEGETKYTPEAKAEMIEQKRLAVRRAMDAAEEAAIAKALRAEDDEVGAVPAATRQTLTFREFEKADELMKREITHLHHLRLEQAARDEAAYLRETEDAAEILDAFENALLSDHPATIRTVGRSAFARISALYTRAGRAAIRSGAQGPAENPYTAARAMIEARWGAWQQQHPSPAARLRRATEAQGIRRDQISRAFTFVRKLYGLEGGSVERQVGREAAQATVDALHRKG